MNLLIFMVCLCFFLRLFHGFSMPFMFFSTAFMVNLWSLGSVTKFYGYSTRVAVKFMVILRLWVTCLAREIG